MAMMFRMFSSTAVSKACNVSASTAVVAMSRRFSSTAVNPRACNVSASTAAANVIFKHIQELSKKSALILKMKERVRVRGTKVLNQVEQELLQSQSRVVHQLQFLRKLYEEIPPPGQLPTQSTTTHSDNEAPLSFITKQFQYIHQRLDFISKTEKDGVTGDLDRDLGRIDVVDCKSSFVHEFIALKNVLEEIACEIELALSGAAFEEELKHDGMTMPENELKLALPWVCYSEPASKRMPSEGGTLDKHRYLLVSNGCEIYCLDLKQSRNQPITHDVPLLPVIASLNLLDEDLPTTVSLFKFRSNVYMIGGQTFPRVPNKDGLQGINLYKELCTSSKLKATSCLIRGLSVDDSKTILSHSESNLLQLSKAKLRPIVEEFNGEIHVIDSLPSRLAWIKEHSWTGSHEVFNRDSGSLVEEVAVPAEFPVVSYLVVGNKIFANAYDNSSLVFDSRCNKWLDNWHVSSDTSNHNKLMSQLQAPKRNLDVLKSPSRLLTSQATSLEEPRGPKDVMHILGRDAVADSIGGFPYGDPQDPLFVVIALMGDMELGVHYGGYTVAFLVNSSGQILCTQSLERFFNGFGGLQGKIIKVEEDMLGKKKTVCSIVVGGSQLGWDQCNQNMNYVLINTFDVEEHPDAADKVREVVAKGSQAWPVEMEFVKIDVLDRYVYRTDTELHGGGYSSDWVDVQACFL